MLTSGETLLRGVGLLQNVQRTLELEGRGSRTAGTYDVVVIDLCDHAAAALTMALRLCRDDPDMEVVLFSEREDVPEMAAVRTLGFRNVVTGAEGRDWLRQALPALVKAVRARRAMRRAEAAIPSKPDAPRAELDPSLPLPVAESRFREAYVRAVIATAGSRSCAAQRAGIPYRTLCKIAQRLEIDPTGSA